MRQQTGSSLIEIIISLSLISILLLGLDAAQLTVLREAKAAYYFGVAAQQVNNMVERLSVYQNKSMEEQINQWNKQNAAVLPEGRGIVSGYYPAFSLTIFWGDAAQQSCDKNKIGQSGCISLASVR